jgi:hypothetical protein
LGSSRPAPDFIAPKLLTQADDKPDLSRLGAGEHGKHSKTAILLAFLQIGGLANVVCNLANCFCSLELSIYRPVRFVRKPVCFVRQPVGFVRNPANRVEKVAGFVRRLVESIHRLAEIVRRSAGVVRKPANRFRRLENYENGSVPSFVVFAHFENESVMNGHEC